MYTPKRGRYHSVVCLKFDFGTVGRSSMVALSQVKYGFGYKTVVLCGIAISAVL